MKAHPGLTCMIIAACTGLASNTVAAVPSASPLSPSSPATAPLPTEYNFDVFIGQCHNITYNGDGNLQLTMARDSQNQLKGYIVITGELMGSGEVTAREQDRFFDA